MTTLSEPEVRQEALRKTVEFLNGWQEQSKGRSLVNTFFHLLAQGKKTTAKIVLEKIKRRSELSRWRRGYINALEGMLAASEAGDRNVFMNQIRAEKYGEFRKAFLQRSRNDLHDDFDKGFFAAWADRIEALKTTAKST